MFASQAGAQYNSTPGRGAALRISYNYAIQLTCFTRENELEIPGKGEYKHINIHVTFLSSL